MPFDLVHNTENDRELIKRYAKEQINIAGVEMKYYALDTSAWQGTTDAPFVGEYQKLEFENPFIIRGILIQPPEAAKIWASLGLFTTDSANIVFLKDDIIGTIGRRPLPRDRIAFVYNNTVFEIQDVLEDPPRTLFEIFYLNVRVKKVIESFENVAAFGDIMTYTSAGSGHYDEVISGQSTSAMIETAMSGTQWRQSEDELFGNY